MVAVFFLCVPILFVFFQCVHICGRVLHCVSSVVSYDERKLPCRDLRRTERTITRVAYHVETLSRAFAVHFDRTTVELRTNGQRKS